MITELIMKKNENKDNFCRLLRSTSRHGVGAVITELEWLDFFEAPASRRDHNAYPGGNSEGAKRYPLNTI